MSGCGLTGCGGRGAGLDPLFSKIQDLRNANKGENEALWMAVKDLDKLR